ncbi:MAG: UPF0179 family protein [Thermoplasmataceae archaeon]
MSKVSLIGVDQAREGNVFTFVTPLQTCSECRIKNVCFNLEAGKTYRISKVREQINPCLVYNTGKVSTIEVEEVEETFNIRYGNRLQEGSTINVTGMRCDHITCINIEICNLIHKKEPVKVNVNKINEKIDCPKGYDMRRVSVKIL